MDLKCPSCATTFRIDPAMIGSTGRSVRCGSCGHSWRQMRPASTPPAPPETDTGIPAVKSPSKPPPVAPPAAPAEAKTPRGEEADLARQQERPVPLVPSVLPAQPSVPPAQPAPERRGSGGWVTFFVAVAALVAIAYFGREGILQRVPQAAGLYGLVGLGPAPVGDHFDLQVTHRRRLDAGQRILVIEGTIANLSVEAQPVPTLRARLIEADGTVITQWDFEAEANFLPSGSTALFRTSTTDPVREVVVEVLLIPGR